jgi:hypothetical protein
MALFKYPQFFQKNRDVLFDKLLSPGVATPHSGIYRCANCAREVASNGGNPLPPQNHHQHPKPTPIAWRLIVAAKG